MLWSLSIKGKIVTEGGERSERGEVTRGGEQEEEGMKESNVCSQVAKSFPASNGPLHILEHWGGEGNCHLKPHKTQVRRPARRPRPNMVGAR